MAGLTSPHEATIATSQQAAVTSWRYGGSAEELNNIAPEADLAVLAPAADLREALDIDSMDFLNFIAAIHHRLGIDIPERDYPKLMTLDGAVDYLKAKLGFATI